MPLPRYQPVKKKLKPMSPSLETLDDYCTSKIIAHALKQSSSREQEPYVGDNTTTERNLSLVCKRWYFLTQTQVADHGVHKIDLEAALKHEPAAKHNATTTRPSIRMNGAITSVKTPRRLMPNGGARTPISSVRMKVANYGVLSQRNMTTSNSLMMRANKQLNQENSFSIKLLQALRTKFLKYKHVQLTGTITADDFAKLITILSSYRIEKLDLLGMRIEGAKTYLNGSKLLNGYDFNKMLSHLVTLTYTISTAPEDDPTNALLWTIYQRATNIRELRVYVTEAPAKASHDSETAPVSFIKNLGVAPTARASHSQLSKLVFTRIPSGSQSPSSAPATSSESVCSYGILLKKIMSEEKSIASLETNDSSVVYYLVQTSNRLCTRLELPSLAVTSPIKNPDLLHHLIRFQNLGQKRLNISIDNFDQIGEVKTILEGFAHRRAPDARCTLNLFLLDQKFTDSDDKVKNLIQICRLADLNVYFSALQRISIDCCHLMWSTGRALQAMLASSDSPGMCIFKITLQTYPIKPNTVNPFEITIPFGKCAQYKISSTREDVTRHREIMRALKKDCYHQFVKSVRDNN